MNALVQTRVDSKIKFGYMGLTVSDAVRLLPFEIWRPNAETMAAMQDAEAGNLEDFSLEELEKQLNEIN